jgi:hypothetical protein
MCWSNRRRTLTYWTVFLTAHGAIFLSLNFIGMWDMSVPGEVKPNITRFFVFGICRGFECFTALYDLMHKNYINKQ